MRLKLRLLAAGCAVLGISGVMATGAGAQNQPDVNVRPYVNLSTPEWGLGTTDPGNPGSVLCLVIPDNPIAYQGKVNGTAASPFTALNVSLFSQALAPVTTCVPTEITVKTADLTNIVIPSLTGGTLSVSTTTSLTPGIKALAVNTLRVHYAGGMTVKLPSGATVVGGALTGGSFVDLDMKAALTTTASVLDATACSDNQYLIDTNTPDQSLSNGPTATKLNLVTPFSTAPKLGDVGVYVATLRNCSQSQTPITGKPVTVKISVLGHGAVSASFIKSATINPQTWDTTRGATCAAVKYLVNTVTLSKNVSRTLQCKGDFGAPIPLALDVRGFVTNAPGQSDPYGIVHPAAPSVLLTGTV